MALVNLRDMLSHAALGGFAVGSFELRSLEFLDGVLSAAELAQSPVILAVNPAASDFLPLLSAVHGSAQRARVPVALHLEAAASLDQAVTGIRHGCTGFTLDASELAAADNVRCAAEAAILSRHTGIPAGAVWRAALGGAPVADHVMAAEGFARSTGIDFLHITRDHGPEERAADRDFVYLVQQCGVMGVTMAVDEDCVETGRLAELIAGGVARIHCDAALTGAALQRYTDVTRASRVDYDMLSQRLRQGIADVVAPRLALWGSTGKAAEVLRTCRAHREVEHLIIYNVEASQGEAQVQEMMATGRQVLGAIPGVRRVFTGRAVDDEAQYRYCWLVRFTDHAVIDSYREHPDHHHFAETYFRPAAGERISIDYERIQ